MIYFREKVLFVFWSVVYSNRLLYNSMCHQKFYVIKYLHDLFGQNDCKHTF